MRPGDPVARRPQAPNHRAHQPFSFMNAEELIAYLSRLIVSQGHSAGARFEVLPWEWRFVRGVFRLA